MTVVSAKSADWDVRPVESLASVRSGKRLPKGRTLTETPTPHPYLRVTDMRSGSVDLSDIRYVPVDVAPVIRPYRIFKDDIFISVAGTLGIVGRIPDELDGANLTENADRITSISCDVDYLMYALLSEPIQQEVEAIRTVGAQPKLALGRIKKFEISIPNSREEQSRISVVLRDVDRLIATLERLIAKKQAIKQGMMQQLLTGRTRLSGFTGNWTETRLGEILKFQAGFPFPSHQFSEAPSGARLVRNRDLRSDDATVFIQGHVPGDYVLDTGDVLIGMDGDFEPVIWQGGRAALNQRVGRLRFSPRSHAGFIAYALVAPLKDLERGTGATTVKHLSHSDVENLVMKIPPYAEQVAIAQVLIDSDAAIDALCMRLTKARAIKQGMMQQLLTGRTRLPVEAAV